MSTDPRILLAQSAQRDALTAAVRIDLAARIYCVALTAAYDSADIDPPEMPAALAALADHAVQAADELLRALARPPAAR